MRVRLSTVVLLVAVLSVSLTGCGRIRAALTPQPKVVTKEATIAVVGAPVTGDLEAEIPEGLPLWPKATVEQSTLTKVPGGKSWSAMLSTRDTFDNVVKGLGAGLQKAGWTVETADASTPEASSEIFTVSRGTSQGVITITQTAEGTTIDYVMSPQK